ncbi:unnamed protein product [Anisakis simplex]|uniref:Secreted protein n=1 Tax=Anisakis simplex TaxID=6269 RepID=A0A0M3K7R8_ANISI|nr:unnamed protein product [Anisakis simplex]
MSTALGKMPSALRRAFTSFINLFVPQTSSSAVRVNSSKFMSFSKVNAAAAAANVQNMILTRFQSIKTVDCE